MIFYSPAQNTATKNVTVVTCCSQADINCMHDHLNISDSSAGARWRYLINTAGQAFPLRTNEEIVSILRLYNGTNVIEGKRWLSIITT